MSYLRKRFKVTITIKLIAFSLISSALIILIFGYIDYNKRYNEVIGKFGLTLKHIAIGVAMSVDGEEHARIKKMGDQHLAEFKKIRAILKLHVQAHGLPDDGVYTFQSTRRYDKIPFAVMTHPKPFIADDYVPPPEVQELLKRVYEGEPHYTRLYTTKYGQWVSGLAPILDSRGRVQGVVEVDYKISDLLTALAAESRELLFITLALGGLALIFSFIIALSISRPIKKLRLASEELEAGNYDVHVKIKTRDELRLLGDTFNSMVASLRDSAEERLSYTENLEEMFRERTETIIAASRESDKILQNVAQGIFLLERREDDYIIGSKYSRALEAILETHNIVGRNFVSLVSGHIPGKDAESSRLFLKHMFNFLLEEEDIQGLNPLEEIGLYIPATGKTKILKFTFNRIIAFNQVIQLLVVVSDVTEQKEMEKKIREVEEENRGRMEVLFKILHVEPVMLGVFIEDSAAELELINESLKEQSPDLTYEKRLDFIYQSIHTIKGNAGVLELDFVVGPAAGIEDKIEELKTRENLGGQDFLSLVIKMGELEKTFKEVGDLLHRISAFQKDLGAGRASGDLLLMKTIERSIRNMGEARNLSVIFEYNNFDYGNIPGEYRRLVKDMIVHLARNSVSHGIENIQERESVGKPERGRIILSSRRTPDRFLLTFRDDGRGIDPEFIRRRALESGEYDRAALDAMDESDLLELIFDSGFSTSETVDEVSGRGQGMAFVKNAVRERGGNVGIDSKAGEYLEIGIELPLSSSTES